MFAITTGDIDGIGYEVTAKAVTDLRAHLKGIRFLIFSHPKSEAKYRDKIRKTFGKKYLELSSLDRLDQINKDHLLIEVIQTNSPARWVEQAAQLALEKKVAGLITAPLSKTEIRAAGMKDMGHTGILKRLCKTQDVYMGFLGNRFNIVLATGHISIDKVTAELTPEILKGAYRACEQLVCLNYKTKSKAIAVLGLNPHSGEEGIISSFDSEVARVLKSPLLVPDAAFAKENWKRYSCFLALYHDQGLIPFKMIHGRSRGAQISLGLPILRTSVDHGTAKDIFGQGIADSGSMMDAIRYCLKFSKNREIFNV